MTHAHRLGEMTANALARLPWCLQVDEIKTTSDYSIEVSWRREDGSPHTFELTYGEVTKACEGTDAARAFLRLVKDKMGVKAEKIDRPTNDATLDRLEAQGKTIKQVVVACDNAKCDRLLPDGALGKPCPYCRIGTAVKVEVTQPRMPMPGLVGRRRRIT